VDEGQNAKKLKNTKMNIAGYSSIQHYVTKFVRGFLGVLCISSTNKTDGHDIAEILLKVALNTIILYPLANIIISAKSHFLLPAVSMATAAILKKSTLKSTTSHGI
jgi:hypothetical protein